jgi:hypothetical protein
MRRDRFPGASAGPTQAEWWGPLCGWPPEAGYGLRGLAGCEQRLLNPMCARGFRLPVPAAAQRLEDAAGQAHVHHIVHHMNNVTGLRRR